MTEIKHEIDCSEDGIHCGACELLEEERCNCLIFGWLSEDEEEGGYLRDGECIDAQVQSEANDEEE